MLSTNNKTDVKKEERKYSWFTVFAWLYLKTIGRILLKRWNKWAENTLYYDKVTRNSGIQTDGLKAVDGSVQTDLKPEVAEKESQTRVISKDGGVQTDRVAFQDMTMQTECVETTDKNIEVDLESEVAEKESAITSEDEGICSEVSSGSTDKDLSDTEVDGESELVWDDYCEVRRKEDEELEVDQALEENDFLEKESEELKSISGECEEYIREIGRLSAKFGESEMCYRLMYLDDEDCFEVHREEDASQEEACMKLYNEQNNLQVNDRLKKAIEKLKSIYGKLEGSDSKLGKLSAILKECGEKLKLSEESIKCNIKLYKVNEQQQTIFEKDQRIKGTRCFN